MFVKVILHLNQRRVLLLPELEGEELDRLIEQRVRRAFRHQGPYDVLDTVRIDQRQAQSYLQVQVYAPESDQWLDDVRFTVQEEAEALAYRDRQAARDSAFPVWRVLKINEEMVG